MNPNPHCDYANDGERITQPGKFEGEPVFTPYFWNLGLEGFADRDDGHCYHFRFSFTRKDSPTHAEDLKILEKFPTLKKWLGRKRSLKIVEDSSGFVRCL